MTKEKVDFDQYTDNYNALLREGTQFFSANEEYFARYKVDVVRDMVSTPVKRVLEYGCGIGRNVPFLQQAFPGAEVIGTDISAASLETARHDMPDVRFEVEREDLEIGQFDLIFVAGVFHHIPQGERAGAMDTIARRLTANGSAFVFEHNPYNPVTRRIVNNCPYDADAVLLKPSELRGLFSGAGMRPSAKEYCLFIPPRLSALSGLEKYLGWLPLGGQYWVRGDRT
ncbi:MULTISPECIES: class I SAM-dependent methyltransferase [unclassified Pseudoxanthomonas]|uniref:class I SAM-dependent methyltransferase n=1 Tax=unclassified Pseudoxanthomonas TaxID=2645906 RepID=UPI0008E8B72B|nr:MULTISPECIES: class I SAM-dependent methyltransferase [unclassified Pseudoxanthomonas]PPJ41545.1 class I SAM-dependent methyltransferase [Pseudoxanthomonas sp. KAs_5_3]SFV29957.1 Methyltransferase domain-containing protein [Pseudoxanthomonas sp. YR558]